jgi:nicotinic acid mononucleotide adenylyltransferase
MRVGVYPGSFNPPTVAHEAIALGAIAAHRLDRLDLVVSRVALAKEQVDRPRFEDRLAVLEEWVASHPRLAVVVTDAQLLVDIGRGYDVLVVGADKWHQIQDPSFYDGSVRRRDAAMAALPALAVVPRGADEVPADLVLAVDAPIDRISSTAARRGARDQMVAAARSFDMETGAWTDPARYDAWLRRR